MKKLILSLVCALMLWSCHRQSAPQISISTIDSLTVKSKVERTETPRDSIVIIPADSSWLRALLACDSNGNVLMKQLQAYSIGKHMKLPEVTLKNNQLNILSRVDSFSIYLQWREVHEKETIDTSRNKTSVITLPPVKTNHLTWWQRFLIISGIVAWVILIIFLGFQFGKLNFSTLLKFK